MDLQPLPHGGVGQQGRAQHGQQDGQVPDDGPALGPAVEDAAVEHDEERRVHQQVHHAREDLPRDGLQQSAPAEALLQHHPLGDALPGPHAEDEHGQLYRTGDGEGADHRDPGLVAAVEAGEAEEGVQQ